MTNRDLLVVNGFLLLFLLINFNRDLGNIYIGMLVVTSVALLLDITHTITFGNRSTFESFVKAVVIYAGFMIFSGIFMSIFHAGAMLSTSGVLESVLKTFATTTPPLANSMPITLVSWGFIVPIIETNAFFWVLFEFMADRTNTAMQRISASLVIIIMSIAFIFALFHLTAKGVTNNAALSLTFIFALISLWLVWSERQAKTAVFFHFIANTLSVMAGFGII